MEWCNTSRGDLAASVFGAPEAPPVLLIAGGGGAMWSWARLLPEVWPASLGPVARLSPTTSLAAEYRIAVYDQAGVGLSAGVPPAATAEEAASDALVVGRQLLGNRFAVAGMSLGGATATRLALAEPAIVSGLVLVSTYPSVSDLAPAQPSTADENALPDEEGVQDDEASLRRSLQPWFRTEFPSVVNAIVAASRVTPLHPDLEQRSIELFFSHDGHDLTSLAMPTAVVCGELDTVFPIGNSEVIAQLVDGSRFTRVPNAGHALHLEAPDTIHQAIAALRPT
jgi:pimeloyl-ACP methyl ester carboxylesterase